MKGIIFNLLEEVVSREHGERVWDQVLEKAGLDGAYTSLGNYPDEHLFKLVGAASSMLSVEPHSVVRWFGTQALPLLAGKYPDFFSRHDSARPFILTLNGIIHPEVRKLYPGAETPDFEFDTTSAEVLIMVYRSSRRLCMLAEGLIEGAATHYNEAVSIAHPTCMHRGDSDCRLELRFVKKPAAVR